MATTDLYKKQRKDAYPYNIMDIVHQNLCNHNSEYIGYDFTYTSFMQYMSNTLSEREREILSIRFGSTYKITLEEVSEMFGVSRERVRQVESQAIRKLSSTKRAIKYMPVPREEYLKVVEERDTYKKLYEDIMNKAQIIIYEDKKKEIENAELAKQIPIIKMEMSVRATNALRRCGAETLYDIITMFETEDDLLHNHNVGVKTFNEIISKVHAYRFEMAWER